MTLYLLELLGTAIFAITGILAGMRKDLDLFGISVIAFVTALGGGTIRDLLLTGDPVFLDAGQFLLMDDPGQRALRAIDS